MSRAPNKRTSNLCYNVYMKKVLVAGTFDIIHPGHLNFFEQARAKGDFLIIIVARDRTVREIKKHSPKNPENIRLNTLQNLKIANKVVLGNLDDKYGTIKKFKPDIICLGYDQKVFTKNLTKNLKQLGLQPKIIRLKAYYPNKYKSSLMSP